MKFTTRYALALVGAMGLIAAAGSAQALDLNGKGSSAGRNFAGQTTGAICLSGSQQRITIQPTPRTIRLCLPRGPSGAAPSQALPGPLCFATMALLHWTAIPA